MLLSAESIIDGTWAGSEAPPEEWQDFSLMKAMQWSWDQLEGTPVHVRRYCGDFLAAQERHEKAERERASRG